MSRNSNTAHGARRSLYIRDEKSAVEARGAAKEALRVFIAQFYNICARLQIKINASAETRQVSKGLFALCALSFHPSLSLCSLPCVPAHNVRRSSAPHHEPLTCWGGCEFNRKNAWRITPAVPSARGDLPVKKVAWIRYRKAEIRLRHGSGDSWRSKRECQPEHTFLALCIFMADRFKLCSEMSMIDVCERDIF